MTDTTPAVRIEEIVRRAISEHEQGHRGPVATRPERRKLAIEDAVSALSAMLAAAPVAHGGEGEVEGWLIEHPSKKRKVLDAKKWDASSDAFWISPEVKAEYTITALRARSSPELSGGGEWLRDSNMIYSLMQDGWRAGHPVMVNDVMIRVEAASRSTTDIEPIIQTILAALSPSREGVEPEAGAVAWDWRYVEFDGTRTKHLTRYDPRDSSKHDQSWVADVQPLYTHPTPAEPEAGAVACENCDGEGSIEYEGGDGEGWPSKPERDTCMKCRGTGRIEARPTPADDRLAVMDAAAKYLKAQYGASYGLDHPIDRERILALLTKSGEAEG